jgi:integrase/recombinase XerD
MTMKVKLKKAAQIGGYTVEALTEIVRSGKILSLIPDNVEGDVSTWKFDTDKIEWYLEFSAKRQKQAAIPLAKDVERVINEKMRVKKYRDACQVALSCFAGLRSVEISRLKISDVADSEGEIKQKSILPSQRTKTKAKREMALFHPSLQYPLSTLIRNRLEDGALMSDNLIVTSTNKPYQRHYHVQHMKKIYESGNLPNYTSHSGRRFFITEMLRGGANMEVARRMAGHSNIAMTAKYYEPSEEQFNDAVLSIGSN